MSSLIPIATYNLNLQPFQPSAAIEVEFATTIRITSAALDPEPVDKDAKPSTLRLLKRKLPFDGDFVDDYEDSEEDEEEEEEEDELDEEEIKAAVEAELEAVKAAEADEEEEEAEEGSDSDSDMDDFEDEEYVICTLSPETKFQQVLDITIQPDEEVVFVVTGSYPIHLSGNYVDHPDDEDSEEDSEEDYDSDEYDLTPDEEDEYDLDDLENASDVENKIQELVEEEIKNNKKRTQEESESEEEPQPEPKKSKKAKKDKKGVQFNEELEHGPGPEYGKKEAKEAKKAESKKAEPKKEAKKAEPKKKDTKEVKEDTNDKKYPTKTLLGGVVAEDRKAGKGPAAKSGNRVGIRYIGKLKNGKVFDKNTNGKPFVFGLGKGECIKGFDLGVAGMAVGGERRVVIPAKMGYGSQALPGIPANSELTFDIKLVSLK